MGRNDYQHVVATCHKGINQQENLADPLTECVDALNVWAPDGRLQQRPGYQGITSLSDTTVNGDETTYFAVEDVSADTFVNSTEDVATLNNLVAQTNGPLVANDRWYMGIGVATVVMRDFDINLANSNASRFKAEYWNGSAWVYLRVQIVKAVTSAPFVHEGDHLSTGDSAIRYMVFAPPKDWTARAVGTSAATIYWIRFNILAANMDAAVEIDFDGTGDDYAVSYPPLFAFVANFTTSKRYVYCVRRSTLSYATVGLSSSIDLERFGTRAPTGNTIISFPANAAVSPYNPATIAVVVEFNEIFIALAHHVYRIVNDIAAFQSTVADPELIATVDDRDVTIGSGAPYDRNLIAQEGSFPEALYITFFGGRLWVANLSSQPNTIRWSARTPFYRVWPSLQFEPLIEDDNSQISGLQGFNEHMVVFKNDSIWLMIDAGLDDFGLQQYDPIRVVAGVGCVSNSSIKQVRGRLIFLTEDGIYAFNGTPNIEKVSQPIQQYINRIETGRRNWCVAAHWRLKSCYLLAVPLDGSDVNTHVLVWDYKNNAWWIWDNIEAQIWIEDEDTSDNEIIYFVDSVGSVHQLDVGKTDHGGTITSYVKTHRVGYKDRSRKTLRECRLFADSHFTGPAVSIFADDAVTAQQSSTYDMTDPVETAASKPRRRRNRRNDYRVDGDWFQVEVRNTTKNEELVLSGIDLGYVRKGHR